MTRQCQREGSVGDGMVLHLGGEVTLCSTDEQMLAAEHTCYQEFAKESDGNSWCEPRKLAARERRWPMAVAPFLLDATEVTRAELARWLNRIAARPDPPVPTGKRPGDVDRWVRSNRDKALLNLVPEVLGYREGEGFSTAAGEAALPATQVTWEGAHQYCRDQGKRLPTAAEWEFAARGLLPRLFPWGSEPPRCGQVNFGRDARQRCADLASGPVPVGSSAQDVTPLGVHDLGGNVVEWVYDHYVEDRARHCPAPCQRPQLVTAEGEGDLREARGGGWRWPGALTRGAVRSRFQATEVHTDLGFRCARDPAPR